MYNHNKAQQNKNRVHISWDILYVRHCCCEIENSSITKKPKSCNPPRADFFQTSVVFSMTLKLMHICAGRNIIPFPVVSERLRMVAHSNLATCYRSESQWWLKAGRDIFGVQHNGCVQLVKDFGHRHASKFTAYITSLIVSTRMVGNLIQFPALISGFTLCHKRQQLGRLQNL